MKTGDPKIDLCLYKLDAAEAKIRFLEKENKVLQMQYEQTFTDFCHSQAQNAKLAKDIMFLKHHMDCGVFIAGGKCTCNKYVEPVSPVDGAFGSVETVLPPSAFGSVPFKAPVEEMIHVGPPFEKKTHHADCQTLKHTGGFNFLPCNCSDFN